MIVYSTIYLMILIMYYKYYYSFIYNWSKFKKADFSKSENDFYFRTEGVLSTYAKGTRRLMDRRGPCADAIHIYINTMHEDVKRGLNTMTTKA
jgi:hypothetical protein